MRAFTFVAVMLPAAGLVLLMAWALAQSGGNPGGLGINTDFGELSVKEDIAPPLSLTLLTGEVLDLADLEGKVVMVDFWSSWCPPCTEEAPVLAAIYSEYADKGVEFLGIAVWDDERDVNRHVQKFDVKYANGIDAWGKVAINYGVRGIPEKYFIDPNGQLVRKFLGPVTANKLRDILDELLSGEG